MRDGWGGCCPRAPEGIASCLAALFETQQGACARACVRAHRESVEAGGGSRQSGQGCFFIVCFFIPRGWSGGDARVLLPLGAFLWVQHKRAEGVEEVRGGGRAARAFWGVFY